MVRIVTDAAVRFPAPNSASQLQISIAPLGVRCGSMRLQENPEASLASLRASLEVCAPDIIVESPSVETLAGIYQSLSAETNQIVSIHTSAGMAAVYQQAVEASQQFRGRVDIQVIDSQSIAIGLGLLVTAAGQAAARGDTFDAIVRQVRGMITRMYAVMFLEDLYFLERNQLVSRSQAVLGNMLGIVPFLTIEEGRLLPMEKVRSRLRAVEKLIEFVSEFSSLAHLSLIQPGTSRTDETQLIFDRLRMVYPATQFSITSYGPVLASFVGFDCLGAVVLEAEGEEL